MQEDAAAMVDAIEAAAEKREAMVAIRLQAGSVERVENRILLENQGIRLEATTRIELV
jgi:hypothetical protein